MADSDSSDNVTLAVRLKKRRHNTASKPAKHSDSIAKTASLKTLSPTAANSTAPTAKSAVHFPSYPSSPALKIKVETDHIAPPTDDQPKTGPFRNRPAEVVRRSYALVAKSLRETLVSKLISDENLDVDSAIDLANAAFESLGSLEGESSELFRAVGDLITQRRGLEEVEEELERNGHCRGSLVAWSSRASAELMSARASVEKYRKEISEKKALVGKLEGEIRALEAGCEALERTCEAAVGRQREVAKRIEEEKEKARRISGRRVEAKAGVERTKALLASLLA